MLRQLFTLIAVISGFTLAAEPVQAAQGAVVSVTATCEAAEIHAPAAFFAERLSITGGENTAAFETAHYGAAIPLAPRVRLLADRAHE